MFHIYKPSDHPNLVEVYRRQRDTWQWFYDSSNTPWKTESGAKRALEKLKKKYKDFSDAYVGKAFLENEQ
jgi:hypothetical protein